MDMFKDKLVRKMTAQEIIKANTEADTKELNTLKAQVAGYDECLTKLQKLIDVGTVKLAGAHVNGEEINRLVAKALQQDTNGQKEIRQLSGQLETMGKSMQGRLEHMDASVLGRLDGMEKTIQERFGSMGRTMQEQIGSVGRNLEVQLGSVSQSMQEQFGSTLRTLQDQLDSVNQFIEAQFGNMDKAVKDQLDDYLGMLANTLDEKLGKLGEQEKGQNEEEVAENVHRECVKVYRNVQAVVMEESSKQRDSLSEAKAWIVSLRKRQKMIVGISVTAVVFGVVNLAAQILSWFNIF